MCPFVKMWGSVIITRYKGSWSVRRNRLYEPFENIWDFTSVIWLVDFFKSNDLLLVECALYVTSKQMLIYKKIFLNFIILNLRNLGGPHEPFQNITEGSYKPAMIKGVHPFRDYTNSLPKSSTQRANLLDGIRGPRRLGRVWW